MQASSAACPSTLRAFGAYIIPFALVSSRTSSNKQEMEDFARTHFHLLGFERYAGATNKGQFLLAFLSVVRTLEDQGFSAEKCTVPRDEAYRS